MIFDVKIPILGFSTTTQVRLEKSESGLATLSSVDGEQPFSFKMLNPYVLMREYEFELPSNYKALLEVTESSNIEIYNVLILNKNIQESSINLLAPVMLNYDNHTMAQIVLDSSKYPYYHPTQEISAFIAKIMSENE